VQGQRAEAHARAHAVVLEPDILRGMSTLPLPPPPPPPMPRPPALVTVMPAPPATFPDATPAAGSATPGTPGEEHETMTLSKGTVRLGLRHRDSFAVHKSHLDHAHAGGDQIVAAIKSASAAGKGHSSMASMMSVSGVPSARAPAGNGRVGARSAGSGAAEEEEEEDDGGSLDEGGAEEDGNVQMTVDPDSESAILAVLESVGGAEAAAHAGGAAGGRKKSRIKSMAKGLASALGLRKSKKKRLEEEEARAAGGSMRGGVPSALLSPSAKPMFARAASAREATAPLEGASAEHLVSLSSGRALVRAPSSPLLAPARADVPSTEGGSWEEHEPNRDELGYAPCHHKEVRVPSILKGSAMSRRSLAVAAAAAAAGLPSPSSLTGGPVGFTTVRGAEGIDSVPAPSVEGEPSSPRRGIVFADVEGRDLTHTSFSELLHYGEHSEHEEWEEDEGSSGKCAIM
jgi:hypothetical protein